ncbi:glyoxalase-like protein [Haloarcula quadrata]|uniref:Glyoxalase-like protein n=1 Tax=Haloarcula quadrata TaxID=182779 RepID=A0A495QQQ2_9EURY|nr:VOC family protein [Haloarcula quadrata]RKS75172.1 glyoxalase-like protein [Haloarcula quadrata]
MDLEIDHVTIAATDLEQLQTAAAEAGLPTEYGGEHSNGVTHMAVTGFQDGSYIEYISAFDKTAISPWWHVPIQKGGGSCAWAIRVDDIEAVSLRLRERDVTVDGPDSYQRVREDGTRVEWQLASLGGGDPGKTLPFLIEDETPRSERITPTADLTDHPLTGIERVVLAVSNLEHATARFETAFGLNSPQYVDDSLPAEVADFPGTPVILAEPDNSGWLRERLDRFGPLPVAYLLGTTDRVSPFPIETQASIATHSVDWLTLKTPIDRPYIGIITDNLG